MFQFSRCLVAIHLATLSLVWPGGGKGCCCGDYLEHTCVNYCKWHAKLMKLVCKFKKVAVWSLICLLPVWLLLLFQKTLSHVVNLNTHIFTLFPSSSCQPFSWASHPPRCVLCQTLVWCYPPPHPPQLTPFTTFMSLRSPSSPPPASTLWWVPFLIQSLLGFCSAISCHWSLNTTMINSLSQ